MAACSWRGCGTGVNLAVILSVSMVTFGVAENVSQLLQNNGSVFSTSEKFVNVTFLKFVPQFLLSRCELFEVQTSSA
jgi:hypothetical protein